MGRGGGRKRGRKLWRVFYPATLSYRFLNLLVAWDGGLDELQVLVGSVSAVFDLLEFVLVDAAHAGEELRDVALPLLSGAHALGSIKQGELFFQVVDGVRLEVGEGQFGGIVLTGPFQEEALVFGNEGFQGFLLQHVDGAQVDAEEFRGDFRVLFGIRGVGDQDDRVTDLTHMQVAGDLPALFLAGVHMGSPQGHAVADAVVKRGQSLGLVHILDGDVLVRQAQDLRP